MKEERIAFEPSTGKVPYKVLKVSVPLLLGKAVWIPTGMEEEGDEETGETVAGGPATGTIPAPHAAEPPAAAKPVTGTMPAPFAATPPVATTPPQAPPAPPVSAASLTGAWTKLVKEVQAYAAAHPEHKAELFKEMAAISELLKANKAAEAKPKMDQMQAKLDAAPPAAADVKPTGAADAQAHVAVRWTALVKELQSAAAAHPEKKAELVRASAGIGDMIRAGKIDLANKLMDTVESLLKENPREKEYRARHQALEERLAAALKDPARDASRLRAVSAFAAEKAEAGDFDAALKALKQLEDALAAAPAAGTAEQQGAPYKGIVAYRKALLEFDQAKKAVDAQVQALAKAVVGRSPVYEDLADAIEDQISGLNEEIGDAIDEAMSVSGNQAAPVTDAVKASIQKYLNDVAASPLVKRADSNPFGVNVSIEKTLVAALQHVRQSLPVPA
jgi:hypothetical protein